MEKMADAAGLHIALRVKEIQTAFTELKQRVSNHRSARDPDRVALRYFCTSQNNRSGGAWL